MPEIRYSIDDDKVATITLDRDHKRNAINRDMAARLLQNLDKAEHHNARIVVIRANRGAHVWCAGHDLSELDPQEIQDGNTTLDIVARIQSLPIPVIAMIEGSVHGGGLLLALSADIVIATDNAHATITSNKLGVPLAPQLLAYWLRVMGLHKTKEMLFTAAPISAQEAYIAGLYNHVVEPEQLESATQEVIGHILGCARESLASTKRQLNLIAHQTAISESELNSLHAQNSAILNDPTTRKRIEKLLDELREPR